jgi:hypothetical protein
MTGTLEREADLRWTALAGALFAVSFLAGMLLLANFPLQLSFPDHVWTAWYEDGGNRARQLVGACLVVISSLAFVAFVAGFVSATKGAEQRGFSALLAQGSAVLFAAMAMAGGLTLAAVSAVVTFGPDASGTPDPEIMRFLDQAGAHGLIGLAGGWSAVVCVATLAMRARRSTLLPRWLSTAGGVSAVLLLASPAFGPLLVLPLWVLAATSVFWRRSEGAKSVSSADPAA